MMPMHTAPRDGTKVKLFRKHRPRMECLVVYGRWRGGPYWKAYTPHGCPLYPYDRDLNGWEPLPERTDYA